MSSNEKFSLLRNILKTIGLSAEAIDDITDRIAKRTQTGAGRLPLSPSRRFCLQKRRSI
jgi:hypothetical protein